MRLVRALRAELGTDFGTVRRVADQLGFGVESVRKWVRQADIDDIALRLNTRPRKTLNYNTPAATLAHCCADRLSPQIHVRALG